jgi:hypothetical protein
MMFLMSRGVVVYGGEADVLGAASRAEVVSWRYSNDDTGSKPSGSRSH